MAFAIAVLILFRFLRHASGIDPEDRTMPQLSQLSEVYLSQSCGWRSALGFIFFVIARGMVPKIQATVDARETAALPATLRPPRQRGQLQIRLKQPWRERMDSARAEAARLSQEAKAASGRDTEAKVKAAANKINLKVESAEGKIRDALAAARSEIEAVAADATQQMVQRLTGISVDKKEAAAAVKAELNV